MSILPLTDTLDTLLLLFDMKKKERDNIYYVNNNIYIWTQKWKPSMSGVSVSSKITIIPIISP